MKTVALFGGSYDPPHIGHIAIVEALKKLKFIDTIVVMPTFLNPFKRNSYAPAQKRLEWLLTIFDADKKVVIDDFEVKQNTPTPTIQTVKYLQNHYDKIYVVIGADNLASLHKWKNYEELASQVTFIVASRDDIEIDKNFIQLKIDKKVSSSQLRKEMDISLLPKKCAIEIANYYKECNEYNS